MVDSVYKYPACLGGAIWSGIDDIFHIAENRICGYGPWGPIDGWRREKPEYIGMKRSYSPVIITNFNDLKSLNGEIILNLENRYNFTNLNELEISAKAGNFTFPLRADIDPMNKGSLIIKLPANFQDEKLYISFTDPRGFICHEVVIGSYTTQSLGRSQVKADLVFKEEYNNFIIKSGNDTFIIDRGTGEIDCTSSGEQVILSGGELIMIPFNNDDGGAPNIANNGYTQDIKPLNYGPVDNYKPESVNAIKQPDGTIHLIISGRAGDKLEGKHEYKFADDGSVEVSYDYTAMIDFKGKERIRQYGILFTLPGSFDLLTWKRKGLWSMYPDYDINRLEGFTKAAPREMKYVEIPREIPSGLWKESANKLGTNDFRSTKDNILRASLKNDKALELAAESDGSQSVRAWVDGDKIRFLVAGMNGPGSCGFFTGPRPEFAKGDHLKGRFTIYIQ
jgi:hypothetical protein